MSRSTFFLSRSRFLKLRFFSRDFDASRFLSRFSRRVEIIEICRDASRFSRFVEMQSRFVKICREISTALRPFESENDEKSQRIEKSWQENTKIHALLDRDRDKMSRNAEIFRSRRKSRSSRLTFWRCRDFLDCRDSLFGNVEIESLDRDHVETNWDPQG
jgi:hypothetical protein